MAKFSTLALSVSMTAAAIAAPAAANEDALPRALVSYSDLDLSQAADVERLTSRIERAARKICVSEPRHDLRRQAQSDACRAQAIRSVEGQLANLLDASNIELAGREGKLAIRP